MKIITTVMLSFLLCSQVYAWGKIGHRIVGGIADKHITVKTKRALKKILGADSLAEMSTWPDLMRSNKGWRYASSWHYVSIPDAMDYYSSPKRDTGDIVRAMMYMEDILKNKKSSDEHKRWAVNWMIHLVGDIHQPLHAGRSDDRGGNDTKVTWFGTPTNLHKVWDEHMIQLEELSYTEYIDFIHHPTRKEVKAWKLATYVDWTHESMEIRKGIYNFGEGKYGAYDYSYQHKATMHRRMVMGGVRLGNIFNSIFDKLSSTRKFRKAMKKMREKVKVTTTRLPVVKFVPIITDADIEKDSMLEIDTALACLH